MKSAPRSFSSTGKISRSALIAGAVLAAVTAAAAVVVAHEGGGDERASAVDAGRRVLAAAQAWQTSNSEGCPTITQLVEDGQLEKSERTDDPWGNRYRIVCDGTHAVVRSAGPDKHSGTPDDVTITRDES